MLSNAKPTTAPRKLTAKKRMDENKDNVMPSSTTKPWSPTLLSRQLTFSWLPTKRRLHSHNYANVAICVNGTMEKGEYKVQVAKDSLSLLLLHAIQARSFDKNIFHKIMGTNYSESSTCWVVAWDVTGLEMCDMGLPPQNGFYHQKRRFSQL
jgi:hypothetical protein